jgi:importin-4
LGKEQFLPYMDKSFQLAIEGMKSDQSRLRESAFGFFAVVASVLEKELHPALPEIISTIFHTLEQDEFELDEKTAVEEIGPLLNGESDIVDTDDEDDDESLQFNVSSGLNLEKEVAAYALGEIFVKTEEHFLPYLKKATEELIEQADSYVEGSRKAALVALWKFVMTLAKLQVTEPWQPGLPVV